MSFSASKLRYSSKSDVGKKRAHNEDDLCTLPKERFFAVADGMGGHAGGGVASKLAIKTISSLIQNHQSVFLQPLSEEGDLESSPVAKLLSDALRSACQEIFLHAKANQELLGMGTTATAMVFHHENVFIGHVGDSRAYLLRDSQLLQLSEDHSLINEQLKAGLITPEQAKQSRFRNIITRSIGFESDVDVDMIALQCKENDIFLLCTDGLTGLVTDDEISELLRKKNLDESSSALVDLANDRGGEDNISLIIVQVLAENNT